MMTGSFGLEGWVGSREGCPVPYTYASEESNECAKVVLPYPLSSPYSG